MFKSRLFNNAAMAVCFLAAAGIANAKEVEGGKAILNGKVSSVVATQFGKKEIRGNVSAFFRLNPNELDKGQVYVGALNLLYKDVPQALISGRKSERKTGTLSFMLGARKEAQRLEYNPQELTIKGVLHGVTSISQFQDFIKPSKNEKEHDFDGIAQRAKINVLIQLQTPLQKNSGSEKPVASVAKMKFIIDIETQKDYDIPQYRLTSATLIPQKFEIVWWPRWEVAKELCVQPVRVGSFIFNFPGPFIIKYSGDGWAFGQPGMNTEWAKADVVFKKRAWKTVFKNAYSTFSESESTALLAEVDDIDCVEIFFVDRFSPNSMWGGGATFSGGSADTKIISSDENADHGIDLTHLAHEVGHAITLKHPGSGYPTASQPHRVDGSSGTLICPSGFMNDNPQVNSQWNKDSVQNPLFKFRFKVVSAGPDCQNDADCGACP